MCKWSLFLTSSGLEDLYQHGYILVNGQPDTAKNGPNSTAAGISQIMARRQGVGKNPERIKFQV